MAVSSSLRAEASMQLVETASAKAKDLSVSFYSSVSCSGPKLSVGGERCEAFRRREFKFPECRGVKKVSQVKAVCVKIVFNTL